MYLSALFHWSLILLFFAVTIAVGAVSVAHDAHFLDVCRDVSSGGGCKTNHPLRCQPTASVTRGLHEVHETCHSVTFNVLVNSHQR